MGSQAPATAANGKSAWGPSIQVLLVEDEPDIGDMYLLQLRLDGYRAEIARTGHGALETARDRSPRIVLLDIGLPDMTGLEVLERLAADEVTSRIPVLVLSSFDDPEMVVRARELGALDWLQKHQTAPGRLSELVGSRLSPAPEPRASAE